MNGRTSNQSQQPTFFFKCVKNASFAVQTLIEKKDIYCGRGGVDETTKTTKSYPKEAGRLEVN